MLHAVNVLDTVARTGVAHLVTRTFGQLSKKRTHLNAELQHNYRPT